MSWTRTIQNYSSKLARVFASPPSPAARPRPLPRRAPRPRLRASLAGTGPHAASNLALGIVSSELMRRSSPGTISRREITASEHVSSRASVPGLRASRAHSASLHLMTEVGGG